MLIQLAYNIKDFQVRGGPSWVGSERYDVNARAEGPATFEQMRPMLRSMLADRFQLTLRHETRELPFYELVASNDGLRISAMKEGSCVGLDQAKPLEPLNICGGIRRQSTPEGQVLQGVGISMATLTDLLSDAVGRVVVDKTGFTELFSFRVQFANRATAPVLDAGPTDLARMSDPSIMTAIEEQLGIRMRSVIGPVEVLVIEQVERPSAN